MDQIFDHRAVVANKLRALRRHGGAADFLMVRACEDLEDRLSAVQRDFPSAACVFSHTPHAAEAVRRTGKARRIVGVEADAALLGGVAGDMSPFEMLPPGLAELDLVVSLYSLHEMNDIPGMLVQMRRALKPDGLFIGCMAGAGTLAELKECLLRAETETLGGAAPRIFPFPDIRDAGGLLQRAGFALPVTDVDEAVVRYDDIFALMHDLRAMGATNSLTERSRRPLPRAVLMRASEIYSERFSDADGRLRATFSTIWMSGWAPSASQQKPLRPGSAQVSLKSVLEKPG